MDNTYSQGFQHSTLVYEIDIHKGSQSILFVFRVVFTGVYKGPLYTAAVPTTSSDGLDFFVVLGEEVSQLDLERGREQLVVGGPLLGVENERFGDLVTLPVRGDHVVLLQVFKHEGAHFGAGAEGCVVAGGIDACCVEGCP